MQTKPPTKVRPPKEKKNTHNARGVPEIASKNLPSKLASALHLMSISTHQKRVALRNISTAQVVSMGIIKMRKTSMKCISVLNRRCASRKARSLLSSTLISKHRPYMEVDLTSARTTSSYPHVWGSWVDEITG